MTRSALVFVALFAISAAVSLLRTPYGPALGFSDHYTHMNAARLLPRCGLDLWREPIDAMFPPAGAAESDAAPADVRAAGGIRQVPGWPADKPFVGTWTHVPRPYPPGVYGIVAPVALLYHFTPLSFGAACHLLILVFLGFAHAAFLLVWRRAPDEGRALYLASAAIAYAYVVFWTLRGFYDAAAMVPMIACATCLERRTWLGACALFALAVLVHFRALFYVPWAIFAAYGLLRDRAWRRWGAREWIALLAAGVAAGAALATFAIVSPSLSRLPPDNPIHIGYVKPLPAAAFVAAAAIAAALMARARAYLDLAMLGWIAAMFVAVRQLQAWHVFMLLPWVFARASSVGVRAARVELVVVLTTAVVL